MASSKLEEETEGIAGTLQTAYSTIKRERPWDVRLGNKIYTTAKEKYMIELIKEGHKISDKTIEHVVGRCYTFHEFEDGKYVCWFGFILMKEEYPAAHFLCKSFHKLNKRLVCHNGAIYYPVDILSNPFGDWQPDEKKEKPEILEVYDMIKQRWPETWYADELHKYTLKYLINIIKKGSHVTEDMKRHIVNCCDIDGNKQDDNYFCYSGFLIDVHAYNRMAIGVDIDCFNRQRSGLLNYVMNRKLYEHTGIRSIEVSELRFRKYQTAQKVINNNRRSCMKNVKNVYDRILHRDLISPIFANNIRLTWQEQYLIDEIERGEDIPNEVISHVLDGCYTWGHLLTENYACCRGYILNRKLFSCHEVEECSSHHVLNDDLKCYEGRVYHRDAEIPAGNRKFTFSVSTFRYPRKKGFFFSGRDRFRLDLQTPPRIPHRPAPPPVDHLDIQPLQWRIGAVLQQNAAVANVPRINNEINIGVNEPLEQNLARNVQRNAAPPPPEVEI